MKFLLSFLICTSSFLVHGQDASTENYKKHNEIKFNGITSLFYYNEFSYERIITNYLALGVSAGVSDNYFSEYTFKPILLPYARVYPLGNRASGIFLELHVSYFIRELRGEEITGTRTGFALGYKFLSKNKWIGEVFAGGSGNFSDPKEIDMGAYPRIGLQMGKRF